MGAGFTMFHSDNLIGHIGAKEDLSINRADLTVMVDRGIVYPRSKSILNKGISDAQIVVDYSCVEDKCSLESALKEMTSGPKAGELKALGVQELTKEIVSVINKNPTIFPSSSLNGYVFQTVGKPYLFVRNSTEPGPGPDGRSGFLDLRDVKKMLIFEAMRQEESKSRAEAIGVGVLIGIALMNGGSWMVKMLRK